MPRLPQPGSDNGTWGQILNDYLLKSHAPDGSLKPGIVQATHLLPTAGSNGQVLVYDSTASGNLAWKDIATTAPSAATPSSQGVIQLAGDLGGTAAAPTVPALASKYTKPAGGIPASDLAGAIPANKLDTTIQASITRAASSVQTVNSKTPDGSGAITLTASDLGISAGASRLVDLTDVSASGPANGQVLQYNATTGKWVAGTVTSTVVTDASTGGKGIIQLAGDLGGTAASPTVPALSSKANTADVYTKAQADTAFVPLSQKGANSGIATLDASGKVPASQLPAASSQVNADWTATSGAAQILNKPTIPSTLGSLTNVNIPSPSDGQVLSYDAASSKWVPSTMSIPSATPVATTSSTGTITLAGDLGGSGATPSVLKVNGVAVSGTPTAGQVLTASSGTAAAWTNAPAGAVTSVASRTGDVVLTKSDVGLANVDNTADTNKSVLSASKLTTARTINGVSFDGSANITISDSTKAATTTTLTGTKSLTGGGDLTANRTLELVGDAATPGSSMYYGTNGTGAKGYYALPAGSAGEINTASNIGTAGIGVYKQKTGVNLEFKKLNAASNKLTLTDDTTNNKIDIDVNTANLGIPTSLSGLTGDVSISAPGAGQVLTYDATTSKWKNQAATGLSDPTTTKGDLIARTSTAATRLAVGTDGQVLTADAAQTTGMKWSSLTKSSVGLANVDNTSDANKPISTATQTALDGKLATTALDIDGTLAANSDAKIASQKATKTYVDTAITSGLSTTTSFVKNQYTSAQSGAGFWMAGKGRVDDQLTLGGVTNQTQFVVKANSGQTNANPLIVLQNSDNTERCRITADTSNLFTGRNAGAANTGDDNTAYGYLSLQANTSGASNTAVGQATLSANTTGSYLTAVGASALNANTAGVANTAVGQGALLSNTIGNYSTAVGAAALNQQSSTGTNNTAVGAGALQSATTGSFNTATGAAALRYTTTGNDNTAAGISALSANTTGSRNVAVGYDALYTATTGDENVAYGWCALHTATVGSGNVGIGTQAMRGAVSGNLNTGLGYNAGYLDSGNAFKTPAAIDSATAIGHHAQVQLNNAIVLGGIDNQARVGIGTTIPQNVFSVSPVAYAMGTATQTGTAVTGTGTTWTTAMVGRQFIFADGSQGIITAVTDATHLSLGTTQTVASQAYRIHATGFQVHDSGRVGINKTNPQYELDVNGSINADQVVARSVNALGIVTSSTAGADAGKWTKLASVTLTAQYADCRSVALITASEDASVMSLRAVLEVRVKQQDPLGQSPVVNLIVSNSLGVSTHHFRAVTTVNTATTTTVEVWSKIDASYQRWAMSSLINTGTTQLSWLSSQGFQAALPTGTQTTAMLLPVAQMATDPATAYNGTVYYNTTSNTLRVYENGVWSDFGPSSRVASDVFFGSTGLDSGGVLSINTDTTKFDVSETKAVFTQYSGGQQVVTRKTFPALAAQTTPYLTTSPTTYVYYDINGNLLKSTTPLTPAQTRQYVEVGILIHTNLTTITTVNSQGVYQRHLANQVAGIAGAVGALNVSGNQFSAAGTNLQIKRSAGQIFKYAANYYTNQDQPHFVDIAAVNPATFQYRTRNGTVSGDVTAINPDQYDLNGTLTNVTTGRFTVQLIVIFQSGTTRIQYGQTEYTSIAAAQAGIGNDAFVLESNIAANSIQRAYLIVRRGCTNLSDTTQAKFITIGKFGNMIGSGTSGVVLQNSTPASATAPGSPGTAVYDANYIYVCTATDTWKRAALTTW